MARQFRNSSKWEWHKLIGWARHRRWLKKKLQGNGPKHTFTEYKQPFDCGTMKGIFHNWIMKCLLCQFLFYACFAGVCVCVCELASASELVSPVAVVVAVANNITIVVAVIFLCNYLRFFLSLSSLRLHAFIISLPFLF